MASKTRMLNADRASWTFGQLLNWHLDRGTRPDGTPDAKGIPWQNKAFARAVGKESNEGPKNERTIRNWRNGDTTPSPADFEAILKALFGGKPIYADARAELTESYHRARREAEPEPELPSFPSSLPTKPLRCLGRDDDLRSVIEALVAERDDTAVLVLGGPGMGKTTVTRQAAVDAGVVAKFGQHRWFVELETATNAEALEKAIIVALGFEPAPARFDAALARLCQARGLLVLDNLETPWDGEREKVEAVLTALHRVPRLALLASIRGNDSPAGVRWTRRRTMHPLEPPHDRELFLDITTEIKSGDPDFDPLLAFLGGVPIAIELVAQLAAAHDSLRAIHAEWQHVGVALAKRRGVEPSRLSSLEVSLELSFQSERLGDAGRQLFGVLGQLPAGIAPEDLDILLGTTAFDARQGLLASSLGFERGGRLDLLPPVRDHARRLHSPEGPHAAIWWTHFLRLAEQLNVSLGTAAGRYAVQRLAVELPNVDASVRTAIAAGVKPATAALRAIAMAMSWTGLGTSSAIQELATACRAANDAAGAANCDKSLADIAFARADLETARSAYARALPLYREVGDAVGAANCIKGLGDLALDRSEYETARKAYGEALLLYREAGEILGEANCIKHLGDVAVECADYHSARKSLEQALLLYRQVGATIGEANCIRRLGDIALREANHEVARKAFETALPLYRQVGNIRGEAYCILSLGDIALAESGHEVAREAYEQALELFRRIQDPYYIGFVYCALAHGAAGAERASHRASAREAWLSIGRIDLIKQYSLSE